MNKLFPLPAYTFLKTAYRSGGIAFRGLRNVPPWYLKTVVFEPLRWIELTKNKKIQQHTLAQDPIFILGFYRSGTSFMHQFLTQDHRLGYHTNYQMILPEIMLTTEKVLSPILEFFCRTFNLHDPIHRIQMSFVYPGEEDATMTTALNPRGAQLGYFFPKIMMEQFQKYVLFEGISEADQQAWVEDFTFLIRKISLANQGKQLILKSPPNTARIKLLLSLYPKAKFILMHRNPYKVYASNQRFWEVTNRIYAVGNTKTVDNNEIILETYARIMDRYLAEKDLIPEGQLIEVPYAELMADPLEKMRTLYQTLDLDDFSFIEPKMKAYLDSQKSFKPLKHTLPDQDRKAVETRWRRFIDHWHYDSL